MPTVSGTTGSPTNTQTGGDEVYEWTSSGSVTFSAGGSIQVLVVGGGASGGRGNFIGGGGGGGGAKFSSIPARPSQPQLTRLRLALAALRFRLRLTGTMAGIHRLLELALVVRQMVAALAVAMATDQPGATVAAQEP